MSSIHFRRNCSRNVIIRLFFISLAAAALIYLGLESINDVYFHNQLTHTGLIINGIIVTMFLLGMSKIVSSLFHYSKEEKHLARFIKNIDQHEDPLKSVSDTSLIGSRYQMMDQIHRSNTPINHSALASTLVAAESSKTSFPKFINNILILSGVFGTIVSLSVALVGASDLLENAVNVSGMGMIVHGMSTALSTTITAIVAYVFFGYFYLKLTDVQTNLLTGIEQITTTRLLPLFQIETDNVLYEFSGLIRSLQSLTQHMEVSQKNFLTVEKRMLSTLDIHRDSVQGMAEEIAKIEGLLKKGFRLE